VRTQRGRIVAADEENALTPALDAPQFREHGLSQPFATFFFLHAYRAIDIRVGRPRIRIEHRANDGDVVVHLPGAVHQEGDDAAAQARHDQPPLKHHLRNMGT
jgi:hypothetical protein